MDDEQPDPLVMAKDFTPRPYQINLFEQAAENNSIIYLPTGTGKTFIAVLLIKHMSRDVLKDYKEDGKRTVFIVNTVALVNQQTAFLNRHTGLTCQGYSGEMQVDFWTNEKWYEELEKNQVLVMTAQIFVNIVSSGAIPLTKVNLLIFDECHRAVKDHPMRQIMQLFANYEKTKLPRVLAMSASLLNANVKVHAVPTTIRELETTFQSKVTTVDSLDIVINFSTNPRERIVYYNMPENLNIDDIKNLIDNAQVALKHVNIPNKCINPASSYNFNPQSKTTKLKNLMAEVHDHIQEMGLYGGKISVMYHLIQLERIKRAVDDQKLIDMLDFLTTQLIKVQKLINEKLEGYAGKELIFRHSSPKILKMMEVLKQFHANNRDKKFCCIIFVQKRFTAKILYQILKDLNKYDSDWEFIHPEFIIGYNNDPYKNPRELDSLAKQNKQALARFRNGIKNCLVATDVVDEGIDIPCCTLIIRYYAPMDFRAYIQSKGRARHSTSHFVILAENYKDYMSRYTHFQETEKFLREMLHGNTDKRVEPSEEDINASLYSYQIPPYTILKSDGTKSVITEQSAVQLLNMYCSNLIKSQFIMLCPAWVLKSEGELENRKHKVELTLPPVSPLKETIHGDFMQTVDLAKRSAAMKACIKLYEMKELLENLKPRRPEDVMEDLEYLFPCLRNEEKVKSCMPGTKAKKRRQLLEYSESLRAAYPEVGKPMYLHVIKMTPQYAPLSGNRHKVFHEILSSPMTFGILASKTMPEIPYFPTFINVGELQITVESNKQLRELLSDDKIESLKCFQYVMFEKVVENIKKFTHFDNGKGDTSYLVVPLDESYNINWKVVAKVVTKINNQYTGEIKTLGPVVPTTIVENSIYDRALIYPIYRPSNVYIVTDVCIDKKAESPFPQDNYSSYVQYYREKHQLPIKNPQQSLLEVKQISKKINCIKPRAIKPNSTRKKRAHETEDFAEHMVPELCARYDFPSVYWLKATTLPSILHRIAQLLVAEELRLEIQPHVGAVMKNPNTKWEPLRVDGTAYINNSQTNENDDDDDDDGNDNDNNDEDTIMTNLESLKSLQNMELGYAIINQEMGMTNKDLLDIDRHLEQANLLSIEEENKIFSSKEPVLTEIQIQQEARNKCLRKVLNIPVPQLKILSAANKYGPSPVDIMKSLTAKMSNDFFDLERVETLGDSFLKYAVSNFLFQQFPQFGEGPMTYVKGKLVGNLYLYYCAERKNLAGRMKIEDFVPSNWPLPAFTVPSEIRERVSKEGIATSVLYEMAIPENQRLKGSITSKVLETMHDKIDSWVKNISYSGMEHYLGFQVVADKNVSDCVEALIGTYLLNMGVRGALKILTWFEILPKNLDIDKYLNPIIPDPQLGHGNVNDHLPLADKIEDNIGYKFKNRAFLLQALSHPSYMLNRITSSYERLEFLGDSVLDFLLTVHIYETCGNLSPGELTDLRSALVNNITFACLAVKYDFHTILLMHAPKMFDLMDRFIRFQEGRNYEVNDELLWYLLEEEDCNISEHVDVPKILGDIFESVIGAVLLDSGMNLQVVWQVIYRLMKNEIESFSRNVPKQPIRVIHEKTGANPVFSKGVIMEGTETVMVTLTILSNGEKKRFHGFGSTKKLAKCAASKQALKCLFFKK